MKMCTACGLYQNPTEYRVGRNQCKSCSRQYAKEHRISNLDTEKERCRLWSARNRDKVKASVKKWRDSHPEESRRRALDQYRAKPHLQRARAAKRRAAELGATPAWLTQDQLLWMQWLYRQAAKTTEVTGVPHHVDHIHPLQGKTACGLHVPWNLQVLPAKENIQKGNRCPVD